AENVASLLYKHMYEPPEPMSKFRNGLHAEIEKICLKMMAKKPEERFQNPQDLLEALADVPVNAAGAEISLAKRATRAFTERRSASTSRQKTEITPEAFPAHPGRPDSSTAQTAIR